MNKFFKHSLPIGIVGILVNMIFFATNLFYEMVVPIIENSKLEGSAFKFFDDLIFYTPCIFIVLFIAYIVAGQIYTRKHHEKEETGITQSHVLGNAAKQKELDDKVEFLKHKYYTNCPNCGSPRSEDESACRFCGTSLIIEEKE